MRKFQYNQIVGSLSFSLFSQPSFLEGLARILDLGNTLNNYNTSRTSAEADYRALRGDWMTVGEDIRSAMREWSNRKGIDVQEQAEETGKE